MTIRSQPAAFAIDYSFNAYASKLFAEKKIHGKKQGRLTFQSTFAAKVDFKSRSS